MVGESSKGRMGGVVLLVLASVGLVVAWVVWSRNEALMSGGSTTTGTVVAHEMFVVQNKRQYSPIIEYADGQGRRHRTTGWHMSVGEGEQKRQMGQSVPIVYDPKAPARAKPRSEKSRRGLAPVIAFFSVVTGIAGLVVLLRARRRRTENGIPLR